MTRAGRFHNGLGWCVIALTYAVAFFQRNSLQSFVDILTRDLMIDASAVSFLIAVYFYGYVFMQIPAGILTDAYGVKRLILLSQFTSCMGVLMFAQSDTLYAATFSRLIIAFGDALVFSILIKYVAVRFPSSRFGLMSGLSQVAGYLGGAFATIPLAVSVTTYGWRSSFLIVALLSFLNFILLFLVPKDEKKTDAGSFGDLSKQLFDILKKMKDRLKTRNTWACASSFATHLVPISTLAAAWGAAMLMDMYDYSRTDASYPFMFFMAGNVIGSAICGYVVDKVASYRAALMIAATTRSALVLSLLPAFGLCFDKAAASLIFGALGFTAGGTLPLILRTVRDVYTSSQIGIGLAINFALSGLLTALAQQITGAYFFYSWDGRTLDRGPVYDADCYSFLMIFIFSVSIVGVLTPRLLKLSRTHD
ncbi:MFS transporter [uncultured Methylobacterium sp.]|uniref:MFS transporter n=1 Tax=uncultured Methylobacterium sp. TaxID=157278 RepID=UPI0025992A60|nr:MFS transporter [uncultured Methylobacterium sp.]